MSENSNEIVAIDVTPSNLGQEIASLESGVMEMFSSIKTDDFAGKLANLKAVSDSDPISGILNTVVKVKDVIIQKVEMVEEGTGELRAQPRVILVDEKGKAFHAISNPLYRDVKTMLGMMGHPSTWEQPIPVKISKQGSGTSQYFTLKVAL